MRYLFTFIFAITLSNMVAQQVELNFSMGHTRKINSVQFSPDGKYILSSSDDITAKLWEIATGKVVIDFNGHFQSVSNAKFFDKGKKIITASHDHTIKTWALTTGTVLKTFNGHTGFISSFCLSKDEKKLLSISQEDSSIRIWEISSGRLIKIFKIEGSEIMGASFTADGSHVVTVKSFADEDKVESSIEIYDLIAGTKPIRINVFKKEADVVSFSPDGKYITIAFWGDRDQTIGIFDAGTGKELHQLLGHKFFMGNGISSLIYSPGVKRLASINYDKTVRIWDINSGRLVLKISDSINIPVTATFTNDDKKIFIGFLYSEKLGVWDIATGKILYELEFKQGGPTYADISEDDKQIAIASQDNFIKIFSLETGNIKSVLSGRYEKVKVYNSSSGNRSVFTIGDTLFSFFNINKGKLIGTIIGSAPYMRNGALSKDDKHIVTISPRRRIARVWNIDDPQSRIDLVDTSQYFINTAIFSADGKSVITTSSESVKVWDTYTGKLVQILKSETRPYKSFLSQDSKILFTVNLNVNNIYRDYSLWNLERRNLQAKFSSSKDISFLGFSKKADLLAGIEDYYGELSVWNTESGERIYAIEKVNAASFAGDGENIIIARKDETIALYKGISGALLRSKKLTKPIIGIYTNPSEEKFLTCSVDNMIVLWDINNFRQVDSFKIDPKSFIENVDFKNDRLIVNNQSDFSIYKISTGNLLYKIFIRDTETYLTVDAHGRYDGTDKARSELYFTCGTEIIELDQVKDQLWVPNLAERIMKGETINAKTLNELNICGLTPEVEDASSKADEYYFKIKPRRGGMGETVLLINGIEAIRYKPAALKKNGEVYEVVINKAELENFFIAGKENLVTLKAYTADNAISSRGLKINEDKTKEAATPPNLYAVMVGVSDYKGGELDLKYAVKDASDISAAVSNAAKKLLNTDGKQDVFMYDLTTAKERYQLPEKNSIKKVLEEIGKKATANDILMIFFAGHGIMSVIADGKTEANKSQFDFLTADASKTSAVDAITDVGISTSELTEWMKPQNIKAQKRILIFDACNSGQVIKDFVQVGNEDQKYFAARNDDKAQQTKAIDKLNEKSGLFILSASASNQAAYEMGRYSQGLLTYAPLKAINQQPDILDAGKYLDVSRWFSAAEKTVSEIAKESGSRQDPQIVSNTNFNIGLVDDEVMAKIILPTEKPLFAASNFQNSDEAIADDDLEISKQVNLQLNDLSVRGNDAAIVYVTATNSPDAYSLSGRYTVTGNAITVSVNIKQNKTIKTKFEVSGTKDKLGELAAAVAEKAAGLVK